MCSLIMCVELLIISESLVYYSFLHDLWIVLVEKILRVQPDVKKLLLLIQASDVESAKLRIQNEVNYLFQAVISANSTLS